MKKAKTLKFVAKKWARFVDGIYMIGQRKYDMNRLLLISWTRVNEGAVAVLGLWQLKV